VASSFSDLQVFDFWLLVAVGHWSSVGQNFLAVPQSGAHSQVQLLRVENCLFSIISFKNLLSWRKKRGMSNEEFQARIKRLQSKKQASPNPKIQSSILGGFSWGSALQGFTLSLVIGFAFANLQAISDMAPQSIKNGPAPGMFGVPVAVISVLWVIVTPIWFFRTVMKGAASGWSVTPKGFPVGLFAGMALTFLTTQFFS